VAKRATAKQIRNFLSWTRVQREQNFHGRAFARLAGQSDVTAMCSYDAQRNAQPQASASLSSAASFVNPIKALKDTSLLLGWNSDARISDKKARVPVLSPGFHHDAAASGRVFDSVVEQVDDDLAQALFVTQSKKRALAF